MPTYTLSNKGINIFCSVADLGCLLRRISNPNFFHPRSEFFPSQIQGQKIPESGSASKNLSILTQKIVSKLSEYYPVCLSGIRIPDPDLDFFPSRIPDPGVKKSPDPDEQHRFSGLFAFPVSSIMLIFSNYVVLSLRSKTGQNDHLIV